MDEVPEMNSHYGSIKVRSDCPICITLYRPLDKIVGSDVTLYLFLFQNLHQMSSSLLEMLDDPAESTREIALSLLVEILEKQVSVSEILNSE